MSNTGMVRRIDHLGRIVIPKEMRKTLTISEGDPVEIGIENLRLVIKKYSPVLSVKNSAEYVAKSLSDVTGKPCVVTDTDSVVCASLKKLKFLENKKLSKKLVDFIRRGESASFKSGEKTPVQLTDGETLDIESQIISPVVYGTDVFGAVVLINDDVDFAFSQCDVKMAVLGAKFLSEQFKL